jgi:hypothetical protein
LFWSLHFFSFYRALQPKKKKVCLPYKKFTTPCGSLQPHTHRHCLTTRVFILGQDFLNLAKRQLPPVNFNSERNFHIITYIFLLNLKNFDKFWIKLYKYLTNSGRYLQKPEVIRKSRTAREDSRFITGAHNIFSLLREKTICSRHTETY